MPKNNSSSSLISVFLWIVAPLLAVTLLAIQLFLPEHPWASWVAGGAFAVSIAGLGFIHRKKLAERSFAFGFQSAVTTLIAVLIVAVLNYFIAKHPQKYDLTKGKLYSLSDQTERVVKGLKEPIKAIFFATPQKIEETRPLLQNFKDLSPQFELEFVNVNRDPARTRAAKINRDSTLLLSKGSKETKVEEPTEEKLTNALIKLLKEKNQTLCAIIGHGERNFRADDQEGYGFARKEIESQSYDFKEVNLLQDQKIPESCDGIVILGPKKPYFENEIKIIQDYLISGGRAILATDFNPSGEEYAPEILKLLTHWYIKAETALIIDPVSKMVNVEPVVPLAANYSKDHPITKEFQMSSLFPLTRSLTVLPGAPADLKVAWLVQTTKNSWGEVDQLSIKQGKVKQDPKDLQGPLTVAASIEGKYPGRDAKVTKNTRILVFGTSAIATNLWGKQLNNIDFFMNSVAWILEDESMISIRSKEDAPSKIELTRNQATLVFLVTVILAPLLTGVIGIVIWIRRRKL